MADYTITITESLNMFGGGPTSLWNSYNWGSFNWGEGTADVITSTNHLVSETVTFTDSIVSKVIGKLVSETLTPTDAIAAEYLQDGSGYNYLFPSNTTNHVDQSIPSYTVGSTPDNSWSEDSDPNSTWS